jgi:hypothetical protein
MPAAKPKAILVKVDTSTVIAMGARFRFHRMSWTNFIISTPTSGIMAPMIAFGLVHRAIKLLIEGKSNQLNTFIQMAKDLTKASKGGT